MRETLEDDLQNVDIEYESRSQYAHDLAKTPYQGQLHGIKQSYGNGLDTRSHGESSLAFPLPLRARRSVPAGRPGGAALTGEPVGVISLLKQMTTRMRIHHRHALTILMAYPDAMILDFDRISPCTNRHMQTWNSQAAA